jgi:stage II sporulation protein P
MFRYRMNSKPGRSGWVVLVIIIGVLLIILSSQSKGTQSVSTSQPLSTENIANGAGSVLLQLWQDVKSGAVNLWLKLAGQNQAKQVSVDLGSNLTIQGSGDDDDDNAANTDVTVDVVNPQTPEAFVPSGTSPQILIYHTHSHESYEKEDGQNYVETAQWRTTDNNFNVAKIGEELAKTLSAKYGIAVLHDTTDNEYPKLGTAYSRSLKTVQKDMAENKDLKILIDLHRDAMNAGIDPSTVTINGKQVARVMIVIGTGVGQTGVGFSQKPDWQKNLVLAKAITDRLNQFNPQLARKVDIKSGRYNQHVSTGAILIEVGHNKNTLDEALGTIPYLAQAIADVYNAMGETSTVSPTATSTLSPTASAAPTAGPTVSATGTAATATASPAQSTPAVLPSPAGTGALQQVQKVITIEPATTVAPTSTRQTQNTG